MFGNRHRSGFSKWSKRWGSLSPSCIADIQEWLLTIPFGAPVVPEEKVIVAGDVGSRSTQSKSPWPAWCFRDPMWIQRGILRAALMRKAQSCANREPTNAFGCTRCRTCSISWTGSQGSTKSTTIPRPRNPSIVAYSKGSGGDNTRTTSPVVSPSDEARDCAPLAKTLISSNEAQPLSTVQIAGDPGRSWQWRSTLLVQFIVSSARHPTSAL